jgi:hypothetical protein
MASVTASAGMIIAIAAHLLLGVRSAGPDAADAFVVVVGAAGASSVVTWDGVRESAEGEDVEPPVSVARVGVCAEGVTASVGVDVLSTDATAVRGGAVWLGAEVCSGVGGRAVADEIGEDVGPGGAVGVGWVTVAVGREGRVRVGCDTGVLVTHGAGVADGCPVGVRVGTVCRCGS